ncbi:MAG: HlyD family efflux transporter periplasmic adaptor subunit [Pseudomonadota bacterium]
MSDLSFQVRAPLGLELGSGDVINVTSWSLNSIEFPHEADVMPTQGTLSIPFQGVDIRFPVRFKPGSKDRELAFEGLTGRQRETLAVFYRSILSGKMASTEDIITSLDTPVDLVPMDETEKEKAEGKKGKTPRIVRLLWSLSVYAMIGAVVFGMLGQQIWLRLSTISVGQARVVAEIVDHRAADGAYVDKILVEEGSHVRQGDTLVVLTSPGHNGKLIGIRSEIRQAEADARQTRQALELHMRGLDAARRKVDNALRREFQKRRTRDFLGGYDLQDLMAAQSALALFDTGISSLPGDFNDRRKLLADILRKNENAISHLKRRLSAEKSVGGAADIVALRDGIITEVPIFKDQFLSRGDVAVTLEAMGPRVVVGWLDEGMAAAVYPGMTAFMVVNKQGETRRFEGRVLDVSAMPNPDRVGEFGLRLIVLPADWVARDAPDLLRPDAPVELKLERSVRWLRKIREITDARA